MDESRILKAIEDLGTKLSARMTSLETKVGGLEGQLKLNCSKLDDMQKDIAGMKKDIAGLKDSGQA